jgi:hypothetical protein
MTTTTTPTVSKTLHAFTNWLRSAQQSQSGPADRAIANDLLPLLADSKFLQRHSISNELDSRGHVAIKFWPPTPTPIDQPRQIKVIHAAITGRLEQCGATIAYRDNRDHGKYRFKLPLRFGPIKTQLSYILFGTPDSGRLYVRPELFRIIAPSSYCFRYSADRSDVIALVRERWGADDADLFSGMFALSDQWHGEELEIVGGDDDDE